VSLSIPGGESLSSIPTAIAEPLKQRGQFLGNERHISRASSCENPSTIDRHKSYPNLISAKSIGLPKSARSPRSPRGRAQSSMSATHGTGKTAALR